MKSDCIASCLATHRKDKMKNEEQKQEFLFEKINYKILLIGIVVIAIGFIVMSGGGSEDTKVFSDAIFNFRRIRLAPTVVLIGFGITIYSILKNPSPLTPKGGSANLADKK
jgi:hypothetical protein